MPELLELSDNDFKAVILKCFVSNYEHAWNKWKVKKESFSKKTKYIKKNICVIRVLEGEGKEYEAEVDQFLKNTQLT